MAVAVALVLLAVAAGGARTRTGGGTRVRLLPQLCQSPRLVVYIHQALPASLVKLSDALTRGRSQGLFKVCREGVPRAHRAVRNVQLGVHLLRVALGVHGREGRVERRDEALRDSRLGV